MRESRIVSRPLPTNLRQQDLFLFERESSRVLPPVTLKRIRPALVNQSIVVDQQSRELQLPFTHPWGKTVEALARDVPNASRALFSPRVDWERGLWITDQWSRNYFHWLTDALPRLLVARQSGDTSPIVIPERFASTGHISSVLDLLEEEFFFLSRRSSHAFRELTLVSPVAPTGNPDPEFIQLLRKRLRDGLQRKPTRGGDVSSNQGDPQRLWVSRRLSRRRWLENEDDVAALLQHHGFTAVHPERLTLSEQLSLFSRANLVAGMHGAGLTNILMMAPGASLLEVRLENDSRNNSYFALAAACGLSYSYLLASQRRPVATGGSWHLELSRLEEALSALV